MTRLDQRSQILLKSLVEHYIAEGQPVGSRALSRHSGLNLSPATVRNVMSDLEELGFITSPHTSAGRIPTARGYRFFVDSLLTVQPIGVGQLQAIQGQIQPGEPQRVINAASQLLSGLTHFAGVVVSPKQDALNLGLVGPVARGSGVAIDVRKDSPYAAYGKLDFKSITENGCCVNSRTMVRLHEIFESFSLIRQCIERMPEGEVTAPMRQIRTTEACARTEAPRGEVFYYIRTNGTDMPARLKWRVPSYMNWEALGVMMRDCKVADVALITNSIDPCVSCTER